MHREDGLIAPGGGGEVLTTRFAYDAYGNVESKTDPRGTITAISYDAATRTYPERTTIANRFTTETSFDVRFGKLRRRVGPDRRVETRSFDALGRPWQTAFKTIRRSKGNAPINMKYFLLRLTFSSESMRPSTRRLGNLSAPAPGR